jgi:hypothetical protein
MHHSPTPFGARLHKLTNPQSTPDNSNGLLGEIAVDAFAFEFLGMVMIALCLVVLAIPAGRRPSKHIRYE